MASSSLNARLRFIYDVEDDSISCNFVFLTKNVPARILRKVLIAYVHERRTYFEFREFKKDQEIFSHPKSTNFEIRFRRLTEVVNRKLPQLRFEKSEPGKFSFHYAGNTPADVWVQDAVRNPSSQRFPIVTAGLAESKRNVSGS